MLILRAYIQAQRSHIIGGLYPSLGAGLILQAVIWHRCVFPEFYPSAVFTFFVKHNGCFLCIRYHDFIQLRRKNMKPLTREEKKPAD